MDFNKILPENFFNLFQSKHRQLYIEILIRIYKLYETGSILGIDKNNARDLVEEILEEKQIGINELKLADDSEDEDIPNYRELANYFLRRLEQTGWITIDINSDYVEILNFTDCAISMILALIDIKKNADNSLFADNFTFISEEKAFRGYIFTIYSLLNSKTYDYGLLINQVYQNTLNFVREIRKVDHKLKEFINLIDTLDDIKSLVELLSQYKDEVMDKAYFKLKTFDNINKYKIDIIRKLEHIQENPDIMSIIANDYMFICDNNADLAMFTATKQINDCIDVYNSLDQIMDEIDKKNRDYISQTLAKVKYLLNDATDVSGLLNKITKFYSDKVKKNQEESAYNIIKKIFASQPERMLMPSSISSPRGQYKKSEQNALSKTKIDLSLLRESFFEAFKASYNEEDIKKLLESMLKPGESLTACKLISYDAEKTDIIRLLYIIIFASTIGDYTLKELDDYYETDKYFIKNFEIIRREE